jgi:hypothetical protein
VVIVDLRDTSVKVTAGSPTGGIPGRETTSRMSSRAGGPLDASVVAVNADFYTAAGYTISHRVLDGEIVQTEPPPRSDAWSSRYRQQFGRTRSGRVLMERLRFSGAAMFEGGGRCTIGGVNTPPGSGGLTVFTHHAAPDTAGVDARVRRVPARRASTRGDTIIAVVSAGTGSRASLLGRDELVLQWNVDSVSVEEAVVEPGDTIRLLLGFEGLADPPVVLVGGLPRLVVDGALNPLLSEPATGPPADFALKRHPRTGVGITRDSTTLMLVTVDGRQAASVGMTLQEFGELMLSLGIHQGLNLDGGGSTTMVVDREVVNVPSDPTGERPVANCLVVLQRGRKTSSGGN